MTVYDPKNVYIHFGGLPIKGFADGSKISVSFLGDGVQSAVGSDGEPVLIKSHDHRADVTVRLMATGAGRNTCSSLDAHLTGGNPALPLVITSLDTGETLAAGECCIKKEPETAFAAGEAPVREYIFSSAKMGRQTTPDPGLLG